MSPPLRGPAVYSQSQTNDPGKIKVLGRKNDCSRIYPGDFVYIPDDPSCHFRVHEVKAGESLWRIARRFKTSAKFLCNLEENQHLRIRGAVDLMKDLPEIEE